MNADEIEGVVDCVLRYRLQLREMQGQIAQLKEASEAAAAEAKPEALPEKKVK